MNKTYMRISLSILSIFLLLISIAGCSDTSKTTGTSSGGKNSSLTSGKSNANAPASKKVSKPIDKFSAAFKKLEKNPLNEDIQYLLWITSKSKDAASDSSGQSSATPLMGLADKFRKLVDTQGVHYTEVVDMLGMKMTSENWLKNGKFKKVESTVNEVTVFDGTYYVKYDNDEKSGTRYKKDSPSVSGDISLQAYGMLASLTRAPYQQKEDQRFEAFDCSLFFMDIEIMGMKGSTLWVDKNTGMLVKNVCGEANNGIVTYVSKFEAGGFKDDVFTIPADIKLEDK